MKRIWPVLLLLPVAAGLFWWGPNLRVRWGERREMENLRRLGGAIALYAADHEGRYPILATVNSAPVVSTTGRAEWLANPLSPYAKRRAWIVSTGTGLPYEFRFAQLLATRDPRDPLVATRTMLSVLPDPCAVLVAAGYEDDWRFGWRQFSRPTPVGSRLAGHAYLLRGDGHVERSDLGRARYALFDGETVQWSDPGPAIEPNWSGTPWANPPWTIYPDEPWPVRTVAVGKP